MKTFKRILAFVMTATLVFSVCAGMFSISAEETKTLSWEEAYRIVAMISGENDMNKWDQDDRNLFYGLMFGTIDYYPGYLPGISISNLEVTAQVNEKYATLIAPQSWWLGEVSYQWQTWTETMYGYGRWADIEGETNSTLIIVSPRNDAKYRVILTTSDGASIATKAYAISGLADIHAPEVVVRGYAIGNLYKVYVTVSDASGIAIFTVDGESKLPNDKAIHKTLVGDFFMAKTDIVKIEVQDTEGNKESILVYVHEGEVKTSQEWFLGGDIGYIPGYDISFPTYSSLTPTLKSHTAKEAVIEGVELKYLPTFFIAYQWQIQVGNAWVNVKGANTRTLTVEDPEEGATYRLVYTSRYDGKFICSPKITIPALPAEEEPKDEPIVDKDFTVEDIVVAGISEKVTVGDALILVPDPVDGTWVYDEAYFSGLNEGITVLEALKEGVTVLKYRVERNGQTYEKAFVVVVEAAAVIPEVGTSDN